MRHIYLIRHGRPAFPKGIDQCIGHTDYPLSKEGKQQAQLLGRCFSEIPLTAVYCSTLTRAKQTAEEIAKSDVPLFQNEALRELYSGKWEGLTFDEIREKYPDQYAKRGTDPVKFTPEQGECSTDGLSRFQSVVEQIINESTGDIAIVAHSSVNRLFLCSLLKKDLNEFFSVHQPYGCINEISQEDGLLNAKRIGYLPEEFPDAETILNLWERLHTSKNIIAHCRAVSDKAMIIAKELAESGYVLNEKLIFSAALLHDIARDEPNHVARGASLIAKEGYEKVAAIIAAHHDLIEDENDPVTEKTVVFLADKLVSGNREVTLEERFAESAEKCTTEEAKASHRRKYNQAAAALWRVQRLIGKEIV